MKKTILFAVFGLAFVGGLLFAVIKTNNSNNGQDTTEVASATTATNETNVQSEALGAAIVESSNGESDSSANNAKKVVAAATNNLNSSNNPSAPSTPVTPVTPTPTNLAPTVVVNNPAAASTVNGVISLLATATDDTSVAYVQFYVDGSTFGAALNNAPYTINLDTTLLTNGNHSISAVASDGFLLTTSATVTINVQNQIVVPPVTPVNLIANPSLEVAQNSLPTAWAGDGYGNNDRSFSYENDGQDGAHSVKVAMTNRVDGDAKWIFNSVPVTGGKTYKFSDWYKSDVATEIDAVVTVNGQLQYFYVATIPASSSWANAVVTFQMPAGATDATFTHILYAAGSLQTDNYSLSEYVPAMFSNAIVSLTFDDAWKSIYTNGLPLLSTYGLVSTQYVLTDPISEGFSDYMNIAELQAFYAAGHEIAGHTVHHCDLTGATINAASDDAACGQPISASQVASELLVCKQTLETWIPGLNVKSFASPYGAYNSSVIGAIESAGYASHRSVDMGLNTKDNMSVNAGGFVSNIRVRIMTATTALSEVQAWVDEAIANKGWLVIVYHEVSTVPADPTYSLSPANFEAQLAYIQTKVTGGQIENKTVGAALSEILPQL